MKYISGGIFALFFFLLLFLVFRIWLEGRRERLSPRHIPGQSLPSQLREDALRPLQRLNAFYEKRDPEQADACLDETMLPEEMLILGTNPGEIFHGRDGARHLLQCDWKYWGQLALDVERCALHRAGNALYFALPAQIKLDIWRFRLPIRITGILEERDGLWYISKLQFINNLNTAWVIGTWVAALALMCTLLLLGLSWLPSLL